MTAPHSQQTRSALLPPRQPIFTRGPASDPQELMRLALLWHHDRDERAREALVERLMPLVRRLARRYGRTSMPMEDLVQVASLGLLKAIDRFDPERGFSLTSFAIPTILGELRRHFRDTGWGVHVPRAAQESARAVREARDTLSSEKGRAPTVNQLAEYMEIDEEQVLDALQALHGYEAESLDTPRPGEDQTPAEFLGAEDISYELVENLTALRGALSRITPREREILTMRFFEELSQREIGERLGVSQMQVSRTLRRLLGTLRSEIEGQPARALESCRSTPSLT